MNIPVYIKAVAGAVLGILVWLISEKHAKHVAFNRGIKPITRPRPAVRAAVSASAGAVLGATAAPDLNYVYTFLVYLILHGICVTDFRYRIIPNSSILSLLALWLASRAAGLFEPGMLYIPDFAGSLAGGTVCLVLFLLPSLTGKNVGFGDVKLAGTLGLLLGLYGGLACIALSGILVLAWICIRSVLIPGSRAESFMQRLKQQIPMGPPLCISALAVLAAGYVLPLGTGAVSAI